MGMREYRGNEDQGEMIGTGLTPTRGALYSATIMFIVYPKSIESACFSTWGN